jgi:AcrR family transcriptional regulator
MRDDILDASIRVLREDGVLRFTTPRVAAVAGVSVGSLYQYFPNKQSLLFALHLRVVEETWGEVQRILEHPRSTPAQKIRRIAVHYFRVEAHDVGAMGCSLQDVELFFEGQPEQRALEARVLQRFSALTRGSKFNAELLVTVLEAVGKAIAHRKLTARQRDRWARATADMVSAFVLPSRGSGRGRRLRRADALGVLPTANKKVRTKSPMFPS